MSVLKYRQQVGSHNLREWLAPGESSSPCAVVRVGSIPASRVGVSVQRSEGVAPLPVMTGRPSTSLRAFESLLESGELNLREGQYLGVLRSHPLGLTDMEAANVLGWQPSSVSGRRNGVLQKWLCALEDNRVGGHMLVKVGRRQNPGLRSKEADVWKIIS